MVPTINETTVAVSLEILENLIYVALTSRDPEQAEECLGLAHERVQALRPLLGLTHSGIGLQDR